MSLSFTDADFERLSFDRIERAPVQDQKIYLDRPYYRWRIATNSPPDGEIAFGAVAFDLTLRAESRS